MKLPKGFVASGVRAGIRKKRPDVALIVAENGANAAAVFTKNRFRRHQSFCRSARCRRAGVA